MKRMSEMMKYCVRSVVFAGVLAGATGAYGLAVASGLRAVSQAGATQVIELAQAQPGTGTVQPKQTVNNSGAAEAAGEQLVISLPEIEKLGADRLAELNRDPETLLTDYPNGGPKLASEVARALVADPAMAEKMMPLVDQATPEQASAIGAGMARAARYFSYNQPDISAQIARLAESSENLRFKLTFRAIGPDYQRFAMRIIPPPVNVIRPAGMPIGTEYSFRHSNRGVIPPQPLFPLAEEQQRRKRLREKRSNNFSPLFDPAGPIANFIAADVAVKRAKSTSPTK